MKKKLVFIFFVFLVFSFFWTKQKKNHFFFSREVISSYIREYSLEEQKAILKDLKIVRSVCCVPQEKDPVKRPIYLATAGLPGAGKSTLLEKFLNSEGISSQMTYLDPDQRALRFMVHTYYMQALSNVNTTRFGKVLSAQYGYNKWRNGAYFITLTLLEECFKMKCNIAHGTTLTKPYVPSLLSAIKKAGYEIVILFCLADKNIRKKAIAHRNYEQGFYQSAPEEEEFLESILYENVSSYFSYADTLYLFWSDALFEQKLAAVFSKGQCEVLDNEALQLCIAELDKKNRSTNKR